MSKKKTHEEYVMELKIKNPNLEVVDTYIDAKTKITHKCNLDGYEWLISPNNVLRGHGCPMCYGNIKKETEQYIDELEQINPNVEVLDVYINAKTPIKHRCKIDGHEWYIAPTNTLNGEGCPICRNNMLQIGFSKNTQQYKEELFQINQAIEVIGEYINAKTPILHRCLIDNHEWLLQPGNALQGQGCPKCANNIKRTKDDYILLLQDKKLDIEVIGEYINARTPILHYCKKHNVYWNASPSTILYGGGCPRCRESKGEKMIAEWLDNHNILFIPQYKFNDCKDVKSLPFDFYLPQYNICIEYDGGQHFKPVDWAGKGREHAEKCLKTIQLHDSIKNNYCKSNNIHLIRIPYFKDVNEELQKFLFILI